MENNSNFEKTKRESEEMAKISVEEIEAAAKRIKASFESIEATINGTANELNKIFERFMAELDSGGKL